MNQTVKSAFYSHKRSFYTSGVGGQRKSPPHPTGIPDATGFVQCALWGSNPRPADYQTQHRAQPPRHADTYTTAPHRGFYIALLLWMCNQSQHTERRENHALGTASKQLYDLATRLRKSKINNRHTRTLDSIPSTCLPTRICFDNHR